MSETSGAQDTGNAGTLREVRWPRIFRYIAVRFPPQVNGVAATLTFAAMQLGTADLVGFSDFSVLGAIAGFLTFVLLLLQLRLTDDIDDYASDQDVRAAVGTGSRATLFRWAATGLLVMVLVNLITSLPGLVIVGAATILAVLAPALAKHASVRRHPALLFVLYESAPASIMFYGCVGQLPAAALRAGLPQLIMLTLPFWCGYQVWKMSRKLDRADYRPYTLGLTGRLWTTAVLFLVAAVAGVIVDAGSRFPMAVAVCLVVIPLVFLAGLVAWRVRHPASSQSALTSPRWSGFNFVLVLEVALIATSVLTRI